MGNKKEHVKANGGRKPKKLMDRMREIMRLKRYSNRTEQAYAGGILRYIHFHNKRHPKDLGVPEIEAFLSHLAKDVATTMIYTHVLRQQGIPRTKSPLDF